ncbi:AraC family transcriptional regulator [Desulfitobacterium sp. LBE]|nr:transcriptional regulator, AraC family [Desulfitobacterium hafniense DCB-2]EHL04511.1 transcriptional regulator, AraC family [Desulfitobacterium hafniense DP7]TWH59902.1 AraC family transcriptional regulator [Desulfitobacterium sp. LBE]CDX03258.1 Transcriptional regulator, AraC [Desulfitobacterium hafniense]
MVMNRSSLDGFFDPSYLENILGNFTQATGLRIEAVNYRGETFSIPGSLDRSPFCQCIRNNPQGNKRCIDSYKRATSEAVKWDEPYFFRCHAGLVIWAVPILSKDITLGSIICGQVLLWKPDRFFIQELQDISKGLKIDPEELNQAVPNLSIISADQAQAAANLLFVVVSHILKNNLRALEEEKAYKVLQQQLHDQILKRKKGPRRTDISYESILKDERRFLQYIRLGDKSRAFATLENLIIKIYTKSTGEPQLAKDRIVELAALTSRAAVEGGSDAEQAVTILSSFYKKLENMERVEEIIYFIKQIVDEFLENIFILADKKHLSLVKDARSFILHNHAQPLTIADAAQHLFISPSHLSRLFRQQLDCTFNDYLTRVRVEKAVELLKKPEFSVKDVALAVGFQNQSHFAKVFRKYIGVTPLVYRNSLF